MRQRRAQGFTLVELVISIVVIGIAVAGVLTVITRTTAVSADPMIQHQGVAIAEAYLEEILTKSYTALPGAGARSQFDDIGDYHGLNDAHARDQFGTPLATAGIYAVQVAVDNETAINGVNMRRVVVTVTPPGGFSSITLSSYRASY